jgi:hypothetical protein
LKEMKKMKMRRMSKKKTTTQTNFDVLTEAEA